MELNGTILLQIFFFLTLLLWLSRSLFAPLMLLFEERERRITGAQKDALELSGLAEERRKAFEERYLKAKQEARDHLSHEKHAMEKLHSEDLARVKSVARDKLKEAEKEMDEEEQRLRTKLTDASASIAEEVVDALIKQGPNSRAR